MAMENRHIDFEAIKQSFDFTAYVQNPGHRAASCVTQGNSAEASLVAEPDLTLPGEPSTEHDTILNSWVPGGQAINDDILFGVLTNDWTYL
jgi:hypothetical protein